MKKTKYTTVGYNGKRSPLMILISIIVMLIIYVVPGIILVYFFIYPHNIFDTIIIPIQNGTFDFGIIGILFMPVMIYTALFFWVIGTLLGKLRNLIVNIFTKKPNPYIYFRELPNEFGIGVTSLLFDSTLENEKDIVAVILDLCARGYLTLEKQFDKYTVKILKKDTSNLLSNERYIYDLLVNNNIKNINYKEWYNYCLQDGIKLELYNKAKTKEYKNHFNYDASNIFKWSIWICCFIWGVYFLIYLPDIIENGFSVYSLLLLMYIPISYFFIYIALEIIYSIITGIIGLISGIKELIIGSYNEEVSNNLKRTKKGINELHKLEAFKAFIKDFGNFADKYPEEIVLWDRYLSYAQVFGLTKEIMKSGYSKLVKNASFQIDDIDNINLDNIEIY